MPRFGQEDRVFRHRRALLMLCLSGGALLLARPFWGQSAPLVEIQDLPSQVLIGEEFRFRIKVSPNPSTTGYGPFIEIYLPFQGADCTAQSERCDGISFVKAEAIFAATRVPLATCPAGLPAFVANVTCAAPSVPQCPGTTNVPPTSCFFGLAPTTCPLDPPGGYQKIVLALPVGSFVPGQAPILVEVTVRVDSFADVGFPLSVRIRSGFRFGTSASGGEPTVDPRCPMVGAVTTPTVARVKKTYDGPEDETATGSNFPHRYQITVDVADGQKIAPLRIVDCLPDNLTVTLQSSPPGCSSTVASVPECPNQALEVVCASVTGMASPDDLTVSFAFFIPETVPPDIPVLGPSCTAVSIDDVKVTGDWYPLDPRDPQPVTFVSDETPTDHTLTDRCLAIQKHVQIKPGGDTGAPGPTPGDTLLYTLDFQVSDFKTIRNLVVDDYLSDGQTLVPGSAKLEIQDRFGNVTSSIVAPDLQTLHASAYQCPDGANLVNPRLLRFQVSHWLARHDPSQPRHILGILTGGYAGGNPTGGATQGRITFEARIDDVFKRQDSSLEPFVDKDDELLNCVEIHAETLANVNAPALPAVVAEPASDRSQQRVAIVHGTVTKTIYAINGSTTFPQPPKVNPGDTVTFHIAYTIPSGDAEDFTIEDYLPLPIFRSNNLQFLSCLAPPPPAPAVDKVTVTGPLCSQVRSFTVTPPGGTPSNSFKLQFGDLNDPNNAPAPVDVYFTTQVTTDPFADGLLLSNQVLQHEQNTFGETFDQTEIAQIVLQEPKLRIRKGVVSSSKKTASYSPPVVLSDKFAKPGPGPALIGTLSSNDLATGAFNSNISGVDACDLVKFAIIVENLGSSTNGAFDIRIRDVLPACLKGPFHLQVVNGKGKKLTCNGGKSCASVGFPLTPLTLDDGATGALAPYSPNGGDNLAVITYDAQVPCNSQPGCCNNQASILGYAGIEGGPNHVSANFSTPFEDDAQACVLPGLKKSILATSEPATGSTGDIEHLTVGEIIRYCLQTVIPEGISPQMSIYDQLRPGLKWLAKTCKVGMQKASAPPCTIGSKDPQILFGVPNPHAEIKGSSLKVNLGTVKNQHNDPEDETFVVVCNVLALNSPANVQSAPKPNSFSVSVTPTGSTTPVTYGSKVVKADIVEPRGDLKKVEAPVCIKGGARYQITWTNTGGSPAFDMHLNDTLPPGVKVSGSPSFSPSNCQAGTVGPSAIDLTCPAILLGSSLTLQYDVMGIQTCQPYVNHAMLGYSSLPGPRGTFPNLTGSQTPGLSGRPQGERVYSSAADSTTNHCPDLIVDVSHDGRLINPTLKIIITVTNIGSTPTYAPIMVQDPLPRMGGFPPREGGLYFASEEGNDWSCIANGALVTCTSKEGVTIPVGGSSSFIINVSVIEPPAPLQNSATVSTCEESNTQNNTNYDFLN